MSLMKPMIDRDLLRHNLLDRLLEKGRQLSKRLVKQPDFLFTPKVLEPWSIKQIQEAFNLYIHLKNNSFSMDDLGKYLELKKLKLQEQTIKPLRKHVSNEVASAPTRDERMAARRRESRTKRLRGKR